MTYIHAYLINKLGSLLLFLCVLGPNIVQGRSWGCVFSRNEQHQYVYGSPVDRSETEDIYCSYKYVFAWMHSDTFSHGPDVGGSERFIFDADDIYSEVSLRCLSFHPGL